MSTMIRRYVIFITLLSLLPYGVAAQHTQMLRYTVQIKPVAVHLDVEDTLYPNHHSRINEPLKVKRASFVVWHPSGVYLHNTIKNPFALVDTGQTGIQSPPKIRFQQSIYSRML